MQQTQVFQRTHNGHDQAADEQGRPAKLLEDGVALGSTMHSTCEAYSVLSAKQVIQ